MLNDETFKANDDLSAHQWKFMVSSGSDSRVDIADTAAEKVVGVLQNKPAAAGRAASVRTRGVSRVRAGGTIVGGGGIQTDASGTAIAITSGGQEVGQAKTSVASGGIFEMEITQSGVTVVI